MATYLPTGMIPGLLSPEQEAAVKQDAIRNAALNFGLQALASSSGIGYKPTVGQIIGQAGQAGLQAYQGTFDQQLQNMLRQQQMADAQRKRQAEAQRQQAIQNIMQNPDLTEQQKNILSAYPELAGDVLMPKGTDDSQTYRDYLKAIVDPVDPFKGSFLQYQTTLKEAGRTTVSQTMGGGTSQYLGEFAKGVAQSDLTLRQNAENAPMALQNIQETKRLLDEKKVFTGAFADKKLALAAAGQTLGLTGKDTDEIIANTQQLAAKRARATLDNIRSSGLGAGQGFTDRDREFLERAVQGNIEFSIESLKRQIEIEEKVQRAIVKKWNKRMSQLPQDAIKNMGLTPVELNIKVDY